MDCPVASLTLTVTCRLHDAFQDGVTLLPDAIDPAEPFLLKPLSLPLLVALDPIFSWSFLADTALLRRHQRSHEAGQAALELGQLLLDGLAVSAQLLTPRLPLLSPTLLSVLPHDRACWPPGHTRIFTDYPTPPRPPAVSPPDVLPTITPTACRSPAFREGSPSVHVFPYIAPFSHGVCQSQHRNHGRGCLLQRRHRDWLRLPCQYGHIHQ